MMAAGSGTRMGAGMPKQFLDMDGKAVHYAWNSESVAVRWS